MFGIGGPELVVILVLGLILVGPEKLPKVVKTVGGGLRDLRRAANLARAELRETVDDLIREADLEEVRRELEEAVNAEPRGPEPAMSPAAEPPAELDDAPAESELTGADDELARRRADLGQAIARADRVDAFPSDRKGPAADPPAAPSPVGPGSPEAARPAGPETTARVGASGDLGGTPSRGPAPPPREDRLHARGPRSPDPGFSLYSDENLLEDPEDDIVPPPADAPPPGPPPPGAPAPSTPAPSTPPAREFPLEEPSPGTAGAGPEPVGTVARSLPPMRPGVELPLPPREAPWGAAEPESGS